MTCSVLVVDDSPVGRKILRRALAMVGVEEGAVLEAEDGVAALERLRAAPVDLVVTDVHMPRMDGVELLRRIKAERALAGTSVIVVTSDRSDAQQEEVRRLGASAYVLKPVRPEHLRDALRVATGGRA